MRCHEADKFAGRDHLGFLPELGKMTLVAGHEVIGAHGIGAFQKPVVVRVGGYLKGAILRTLDDPLRLAHTVRHVGDIFQSQGAELAGPFYAEALAIYRGNDSTRPLDLANTVAGYARFNEEHGEAGEAITLWQEARSLYASVDVQAGVKEAGERLAVLKKHLALHCGK